MSDVMRKDDIQGDIIHEYDGIEEADNELPRWWLAIFYITSAFAIAYWFYYHEFSLGPGLVATYEADMKDVVAATPDVSESELVALSQDPAAVEQGHTVFQTYCVACHEAQAQGKIGPNLTDRYWIHGGAPTNIFNTVYQGVAAKGMPSWGASLGEDQVKHAVAFVLSIRNTNVEGKEPQGEEYVGAEGAGPDAGVVDAAPSSPVEE